MNRRTTVVKMCTRVGRSDVVKQSSSYRANRYSHAYSLQLFSQARHICDGIGSEGAEQTASCKLYIEAVMPFVVFCFIIFVTFSCPRTFSVKLLLKTTDAKRTLENAEILIRRFENHNEAGKQVGGKRRRKIKERTCL